MNEASADILRRDILASFEQLMGHVTRWRHLDMLDVDVTMPQARCLLLVALQPALSISALASQLHISLPAASGLVDRLVEAGYLERNPDPHDRRHQLVTLSEPGQLLVERFHELPTEKLGLLLAGLSRDELHSLRRGIAAIEREAQLIADRATPPHAATERNPA